MRLFEKQFWSTGNCKVWFVVHILTPLSPYIGVVFLRGFSYIGTSLYTWNWWVIFNFSNLSLIAALISFFVKESLKNREIIIPNEDEKMEALIQIKAWGGVGIFSTVIFIIIEMLKIFVNQRGISEISALLVFFQISVPLYVIFLIDWALRTRDSFKLTVRMK